MDGFLISQMLREILEKVMLKQGIKIVLVLFFCSCDFNNKPQKIKETSINVVGLTTYNNLISLINDSINLWKLNKLQNYIETKAQTEHIVDSLICFNRGGDRLISCLLGRVLLKPNLAAGITFLYGEKINGEWYFFSGPHIFIPQEMKREKDGMPFDFAELHQIALKEVYSGYLNSNGEINEAWFTSQFEGPGWGDFNNQASLDFILNGKRFTNKKDFFEFAHLTVVKANWNGINKDSIKQLPTKNINLP
ncbi:hypothetical protein [Sediminibacterium sp.]|uniref:hypothetical protein n=1 Tax=Sediminibacterium sp. TaxID=1917865 RepID=UPI0027340355|nr:hypothetical protein [Sediminibacterium sp.]MDP3567388.1 hypothetical protein [Sediminibacterium sp.]